MFCQRTCQEADWSASRNRDKEIGLLVAAGDLHTLELAVEPDIDVEVTGIFVEVKERPRSPREVTALALAQLREPA